MYDLLLRVDVVVVVAATAGTAAIAWLCFVNDAKPIVYFIDLTGENDVTNTKCASIFIGFVYLHIWFCRTYT